MNDDPLNSEISFAVEVTEAGVQGKAKSRALSGIDRLLGNFFEAANLPLEERQVIRRERLDAQIQLIRAARDKYLSEISNEPELALRTLEGLLSQNLRRRQNKEGVATEFLLQLKKQPPSEQEQRGPEELSTEFLDSFERRAEDASTEEARVKWAAVLAAEVRRPGTFSKKAMRIIDELDSGVASSFSEMIKHRIGPHVPKLLYEANFTTASAFAESDLISVSFSSTGMRSVKRKIPRRGDAFVFFFCDFSIALDVDNELRKKIVQSKGEVLTWDNETNVPALRTVILTATGQAIMGLMEDNSLVNAEKLVEKLTEAGFSAFLVIPVPSEDA